MGIKIHFFIFILWIVAVYGNDSVSLRSSYGEHCNETQRCDTRAWLGCFEESCGCVKREEMIFDTEKKKCVSKVAERCKFGIDLNPNSTIYEIADCVEHSECNSEGYCFCESKYQETQNGSCILSKSHGESCSDMDKCSKYSNLKCVEGTCLCSSEESTFSIENSLCVGFSQSSCINGNCVSGAECTAEGKCVCLPDHYHNSTDKLCHKTKEVFENCNEDFECMQKPGLMLQCIDGRCNCQANFKYDTVQKYEYGRINKNYYCDYDEHCWTREFKGEVVSRCVPLVGEKCPEGYCVSNAKCEVPIYNRKSESTRYQFGVCQCSDYDCIQNRETRECFKKFGGSCNYSRECNGELECVESLCTCPMPSRQNYTAHQNACVTAVGGHCGPNSVCVPNASCSQTEAQCRCNEGFVTNKYGACEIEFGRECSGPSTCYSAASLVCVDRKCSCKDKMYTYSPERRKCVGLVGAPCQSHSASLEKHCVDNAASAQFHLDVPGECICSYGFNQTADYTCQQNPEMTERGTERKFD